MAKFEFGDFKAEIDSTDVEFIERYEKATEDYNKKIKITSNTEKESEKLRYYCYVFYGFFDDVFGKDTHSLMFGTKLSSKLALLAFKSLVDTIKNDTESISEIGNVINMQNRASRRKNAKK